MYCPRTRPLPVPSSIPSRRMLNSRCHLSQAFLSNSCQVCLPLVDWYLNNVYYYNLINWIEVLNILWIRFKDTFRVANDKCLAQLGDLFNPKKGFQLLGALFALLSTGCILWMPLHLTRIVIKSPLSSSSLTFIFKVHSVILASCPTRPFLLDYYFSLNLKEKQL